MSWTVTVDKAVLRRLKRIPEPDRNRLFEAILSLETGTEGQDIRRLVGRDGYRLRVGNWRILLDVDAQKKRISVYDIGSRGDIYK